MSSSNDEKQIRNQFRNRENIAKKKLDYNIPSKQASAQPIPERLVSESRVRLISDQAAAREGGVTEHLLNHVEYEDTFNAGPLIISYKNEKGTNKDRRGIINNIKTERRVRRDIPNKCYFYSFFYI